MNLRFVGNLSFLYKRKQLFTPSMCKIMKLLTIFLTIVLLQVSASGTSQTVTYSSKQAKLKQVFAAIEKQTGYVFFYDADLLKEVKWVKLDVKDMPLPQALDLLFKDIPFTWVQTSKTITITRKIPVANDTKTDNAALVLIDVRGKVVNESGEPVIAATIIGKTSRQIVISNDNGEFVMKGIEGTEVLIISGVNILTTEFPVKGRTQLHIIVKNKIVQQGGITITVNNGYQQISKERAAGSFAVITSKELEKMPAANLLHRIEGLVTGVQPRITAGDNSFVYSGLVQGINSSTRTVGNNDYDINIRGNSTLNGEKMPLIVVDGFPTEVDIKSLNPADIEQITFLKDAAASSIWGTRASNGVIVIETKKGRLKQAPVVNYSTNLTIYGKPRLDYLPLLNSAQQINYDQELVNKNIYPYNPLTSAASSKFYVSDGMDLTYKVRAGLIDSATYKTAIGNLAAIDGYAQYSRYLLQPASSMDHNISVSGGSDFHTYFFSASYAKEIPTSIGNKGERFTVTANQSFKILKKATLSIGFRSAIFNYQNNGIGVSALAASARAYLPYNQVYDVNGNKKYYSYSYYAGRTDTLQRNRGYMNWGYNYEDELNSTSRITKDQNYSGNVSLNIPIMKGLSINGQLMGEKFYQISRTDYSPESYYVRDLVNTATSVNYATGVLTYGIPKGGILQQSFANNTNYSARVQAVYNGVIKTNHQLNVVAGSEIRQTLQTQTVPTTQYGYNSQTGIAQSILASYVNVNGQTVTTSSISSGSQQDKRRRFLSYYGNAAYTFLNRYSFTGSVRYDDYNNFGLDRKYRATPLWSTGIKWDITKEDFMHVKWLNSLSLRTTYGYNGNLSLDAAPFTTISLSSSSFLTGLPYATIISPANPELRWEKTGVLNIGVDYAVLNRRLSGTVEWFRKKGVDLMYNFPIDPTFGVSTLTRNTSTITGNGWEAAVNGVIIENKAFSWSSTLTFTYSANKITDSRFQPNSSFFSSLSGGAVKGYPTTALWAYRFAGLDATGMAQIYGNDKTTKLAPNVNPTALSAMYYAGTTVAPYYGGFMNSFGYKNFSFYALVSYSFGSVFRKPTVSSYPSSRLVNVPFDLNKDIDLRWRKAGDELTTNVPGIAGAYATTSLFRYMYSDINILSGDYIRLREVALSYELPKLLTEKIKTKSVKVSATVRNPGLLWTKNKEHIDPDFPPILSGTQVKLPPSAAYTFSLNVNF